MTTNIAQNFYRYLPVAKRDRDWGLFVTTVGENKPSPGTHYPPAGHPRGYSFDSSVGRRLDEFQLIYISAGCGWFRSTQLNQTVIEAGQVLFLFPGVWHSYAPSPETGWHEHWVGFNGDLAQRLVRRNFFTPANPVLRTGEEDKLLLLYREMIEALRSNHPALQQILGGFVMRILGLLYSVQESRLSGDDPGLQIIHRAITRMLELRDVNFSIPDLARELNVSYRWFRRAFTHHTGLSPHQYFLDIRLARARDLLAHTNLSVKEIALKVGFEDPHYFWRLFHKKVSLTPGEWRTRAQKEKGA